MKAHQIVTNRPLARLAGGYALFILTEYTVWIAMLVFAFGHGGAAAAGGIAVAQLLPAAAVAPFASRAAVHRSPVRLLRVGYAVQGAGMAATGAAVVVGRPPLAYAAAVLAATAVTTTRPAQAALVPALVQTPEQLTAANVLLGRIESLGIMAAGLLAGVLLQVAGPASVFGLCAALALLAVMLVAPLRAPALAPAEPAALRPPARSTLWRPVVGLLTAKAVVVGALDVLVVVLAVDVLHRTAAWAGYLNFAYGAGAVVSSGVAALLVGRQLSRPLLGSALLMSIALAALAGPLGVAGTLVAMAVVGGSRTLIDVAGQTLLQRIAPTEEIPRVFGALEGLTMAGLAVGALLAPLLVRLAGGSPALLGVAAVLPLAGALGMRRLRRLDAAATVPVVQIALLRSLPMFAELPPPAIEGLARGLRAVDLPAGEVLIREGEPGDRFYAVAAGELEAWREGRLIRRCRRGDGIGEIALLRDVPRTATVRTATAATVYALDRQRFLTAVTGHIPTRVRADAVVDARLEADAGRSAVTLASGSRSDPPAGP